MVPPCRADKVNKPATSRTGCNRFQRLSHYFPSACLTPRILASGHEPATSPSPVGYQTHPLHPHRLVPIELSPYCVTPAPPPCPPPAGILCYTQLTAETVNRKLYEPLSAYGRAYIMRSHGIDTTYSVKALGDRTKSSGTVVRTQRRTPQREIIFLLEEPPCLAEPLPLSYVWLRLPIMLSKKGGQI